MKVQNYTNLKKQAGMTLMEVIASLAVMAVVVVGALSLYNSAQSSQQSTAITRDLAAVHSALSGLFAGQGTYGASTTNLNAILKSTNRIPTTMTADASVPPVITTALNGTLTATAAATAGQVSVAITNVTSDVCTFLAVNAGGWTTLGVGATGVTPLTLPTTPALAAAACSVVAVNKMIFVGN